MTDWSQWINERFPNAASEWVKGALESENAVLVPANQFLDICRKLRLDDAAKFDQCHCISGLDRKEYLEVVYHLFAFSRNERIVLKVRVPREDGRIPSIVELYPSADWHEREVYDLTGVWFDQHPDLRRILLPDDWEGYPLRKDYKFPEFYQGWRVAADDTDRTARPVN